MFNNDEISQLEEAYTCGNCNFLAVEIARIYPNYEVVVNALEHSTPQEYNHALVRHVHTGELLDITGVYSTEQKFRARTIFGEPGYSITTPDDTFTSTPGDETFNNVTVDQAISYMLEQGWIDM